MSKIIVLSFMGLFLFSGCASTPQSPERIIWNEIPAKPPRSYFLNERPWWTATALVVEGEKYYATPAVMFSSFPYEYGSAFSANSEANAKALRYSQLTTEAGYECWISFGTYAVSVVLAPVLIIPAVGLFALSLVRETQGYDHLINAMEVYNRSEKLQ